MHQSNVNLLDLPNEILLKIFKILNNIDILNSLFDIDNQRLDMILQEKTFTTSLNFVLPTLYDTVSSIADSIIDRFCINILPKINNDIKSLTLESKSMARILRVADYPNLTELRLYNVNNHIISQYVTNFNHVTDLMVDDITSIRHEFFLRLARFFPFLKILSVINFESQFMMNNNWNIGNDPLYSIVEYPNLISLDLRSSHIHYIDQFLDQKRTHLPRLTKLAVNYNELIMITDNFTRESTRRNCAQVKELLFERALTHKKHFYNYFPLL
ncbi:unnamed protein product [Rotaria magnacalcarata]|uniref:F-box domain-containing protein n=1 Tax=Rotaria magnacalcarata TaxID=392030 RepID=A0A816WZM0_9BILA|nr:unnamed protein product [Rotaria magnacalcarata]